MSAPESSGPSRGKGIYIGRLAGIGIHLDYSWFAIAALITFTLSARLFPTALPGLTSSIYLGMAAVGAALFFLSLLLHELGHCVVSQREGIPVNRITLLFIGGLAEISREPGNARSELKIALGGPAVTLVLLLLYALISWICGLLGYPAATLIFQWLWQVNLALLLFNAIPGYPLDGGRVLRALLWLRTGNLRRATFVSSRCGIAFSWVLMALSVLLLMQGQWNAFLFLLIAFFLRTSAEAGYSQTVQDEVLAGVRVSDLMAKNPVTIPETTPLSLAVDEFFLAHHHMAFPVCDEDARFRGLLRLEFLKAVPKERWPYTSVLDAVVDSRGSELQIAASESAQQAMQTLLAPEHGRLAVVEGGRVVGMITRHDILQFIKIQTVLEEAPI